MKNRGKGENNQNTESQSTRFTGEGNCKLMRAVLKCQKKKKKNREGKTYLYLNFRVYERKMTAI